MNSRSPLCEYCSEIDFDLLRNPTVDEIKQLNSGEQAPDTYPYKNDTSNRIGSTRYLGLWSRVQTAAADGCPLCSAIVKLLHQQPHVLQRFHAAGIKDPLLMAALNAAGRLVPSEGDASSWKGIDGNAQQYFYLRQMSIEITRQGVGELVKPGVPEWKEDRGRRMTLIEGFQSCEPPGMKPDDESGKIVLGGRKRPPVINPELPAMWLRDCLDNHGDSCGHGDSTLSMPLFRLVDINNMNIVDFHNIKLSDLEYATLSYVWGGSQKTTLLSSNSDELHSPGALSGILSQTIDDALQLAGDLGVKYIWVDALNIMQDNDADKGAQISQMGSIYAHSLFTIVAAAGKDANAGLPGVRHPRKHTQEEVYVQEPGPGRAPVSLMTRLNPTPFMFRHCTQTTVWASRGWTLQERALTRRALFVTEGQLLWACGKCYWTEETESETSLARMNWFALHFSEYLLNFSEPNPFVSADSEEDQIWYKFRRLVVDYTGRNLTVGGDAFDAFSAVLKQVTEKTGEHFLWGIPVRRFELGLCWEPEMNRVRRRRDRTTLKMTSLDVHVTFPSWSWLGWEGVISLRVEERYTELGLEPTIQTYTLRNSPLRLVRTSRLSMDNPNPHPSYRPSPIPSNPNTVTLADISTHLPPTLNLSTTPDDQLIFFWTETAFFHASDPIKEEKPLAVNPLEEDIHIKYYRNVIAISDHRDEEEEKVVGRTAPCDLTANDEGGEYEFVLIAVNELPGYEKRVVVLQVKRGRDGVARRANIAEIGAEDWEIAKFQSVYDQWKTNNGAQAENIPQGAMVWIPPIDLRGSLTKGLDKAAIEKVLQIEGKNSGLECQYSIEPKETKPPRAGWTKILFHNVVLAT